MDITLPDGTAKFIDVDSICVEKLLQMLDISQSEVLVIVDDAVVPEDIFLSNKDKVRIIHVVFGG